MPGVSGMASGAADSAAADGAFGAQALGTDDSLAAGASEGAAPSGMAGFPMMGAGTARPEQDRKRHAWLNEDADVWGQPAALVPPVVEGTG